MKSPLQHAVIILGTLGMVASPAIAQLPPLNFCDESYPPPCPQYFVPRDGIPVPGFEIVPWNDPRAAIFLENFVTQVPPESQLSGIISEIGTETFISTIQSSVGDPGLTDSFGALLLALSAETPDPNQVQQSEAAFVDWLRANVNGGDNQPEEPEEPESEIPAFERAVLEALGTLSLEDLNAINASPEARQQFFSSLIPQSPDAQTALSRQGQDFLSSYFLQRYANRFRTFYTLARADRGTHQFSSDINLDLSSLNLHSAPDTANLNSTWIAQAPRSQTSVIDDIVRTEVEAYRTTYTVDDQVNLYTGEDELESSYIAQSPVTTRPTDEDGSGWSAFVAGDIAWGNTGTTTTSNRVHLN